MFDSVRWTSFLENFSSWHYGSYAFFWGTTRQNGVFIIGIIKGKEVVILPTNIVVASSYAEEGLVFDKDWEKEITQKIVDIMLYGTPRPITDEKKTMINFLRTVNLTYVC